MKTWVLVLVMFSESESAKPSLLEGFESFHSCMTAGGELLKTTQESARSAAKMMKMEGVKVPAGSFTCVEITK